MRLLRSLVLAVITVLSLAGCSEKGDQTIAYRSDDPAMNEARDRARSELPRFLAELKRGKGAFSVKVPVNDNGTIEHMWMSEVQVSGNDFRGRIANNPVNVGTVRMGDRYTVARRDISDWMIQRGGDIYGGYTLRVMLGDLPEEQAAPLRSRLRELN